jgi:hypothetical protein
MLTLLDDLGSGLESCVSAGQGTPFVPVYLLSTGRRFESSPGAGGIASPDDDLVEMSPETTAMLRALVQFGLSGAARVNG